MSRKQSKGLWQVYNELTAMLPEALHTLTEPWVLDAQVTTHSEANVALTCLALITFKSYSLQPPRHVPLLFQLEAGSKPAILFGFSHNPILGWQRKRNTQSSALSRAQLEASDALHLTAKRNAATLPVSRGDMLFRNDMAVFHAREGFDESCVNMKRHLMKMYLRDADQGWTVPQSLQEIFTARYARRSQMAQTKRSGTLR